MKPFKIGRHTISDKSPCFVIAEMSGNHNQSLERAFAIVDSAAAAGVEALKLQTYTADTMTIDVREGPFFIDDQKSLWKGDSLYTLYQKAYTPWEWHKPIFDRCKKLGILAFSTPFDATAVDFLESLNVPAYKIASFEIVDLPLLRKVAQTKKPVILSTGMATLAEIEEAVQTLRDAGAKQLALMKCTSAYPAPPEEVHLRTIADLAKRFGCPVGLSDHTLGTTVPVAGVALGARLVEKHITIRRQDPGPDNAFSLEPQELKEMVASIRIAEKALGEVRYGPNRQESRSRIFRRSLFVVQDIKRGEAFTAQNIRSIRPGSGLHTRYLEDILGNKASRDLRRGTPLTWKNVAGAKGHADKN